ncbi:MULTISPECIES: hypothetical protein [Pseudomonas syringae group]|uniref:Uncharacterized protein n=1 Tax=Pseudomonas syringae pv. solidagae TaxID=264458 RepID=A0A0N8SSH3_PSESX|nr:MULTISPECIES: hypothetical protein [Pseudomonas syringae group]KPY54792.1 Uncharacterized protein ALO46_03270 [Pseudomonas syringae pv. solidagae]MBI6670106.1 hypothetical protein [Pseudomonas syringae]MDU8644497.1 hypothetical protein [Pseudomonas syringae group sp. 26L6]RMT34397.1 hypothetical protein ALP49_04098 [Pseudomonas syringae pv. solidagae]RMT39536.1 hypothetical protein ALP48_00348 [Pseudomonas syringae pv. solidagae]
MATVQEFEEQVWGLEGIRLVIRAPEGAALTEYEYKNAAQSNISLTKWINTRINPALNGYEATVIQGNGEEPHGRNLLRKIRATYGD